MVSAEVEYDDLSDQRAAERPMGRDRSKDLQQRGNLQRFVERVGENSSEALRERHAVLDYAREDLNPQFWKAVGL
jgi:muconolactone delta-isomerase